MTGGSLGLRTGSYGSLQQQQNGVLQTQTIPMLVRKSSKTHISGLREKERLLPLICRYIGRRRVAMLLLSAVALLVFISGPLTINKESISSNINQQIGNMKLDERGTLTDLGFSVFPKMEDKNSRSSSTTEKGISGEHTRSQHHHRPPLPNSHLHKTLTVDPIPKHALPQPHPCDKFALPPPPPSDGKRFGPRPCPVCYVPVDQAISRMPSFSSISPVLRNLTYVHDQNPTKNEPHGGSDFGGYPTLKQRNESFDIRESMEVHCGFVKGNKPGNHSGFDIDESDLMELEKFHDVIVASAIFGNYDIIQQPQNVDAASRKNIPFFLFIDEETEAFVKNSTTMDSKNMVGLWKIIVVRNIPYVDPRRNGKVPKLLLHRLFPNVRYSIWIDGKLQLVKDPYQILERFLWRENATFAISRHYKRFDVFEEAEANKVAGKYDNSSIDEQIGFYIKEGLTPYSAAKLPITSDVPEGCVIIREHVPITNLFTCLWFNEVDRFTSRDQLSFSMVRDKIRARVEWTTSMFLDCERRNFVIQAYHRDLLEHMPPPPPPRVIIRRPPLTGNGDSSSKTPLKKTNTKRGRGERRSGSKRHRKTVAGSRDPGLVF